MADQGFRKRGDKAIWPLKGMGGKAQNGFVLGGGGGGGVWSATDKNYLNPLQNNPIQGRKESILVSQR